MKKTQKLPRRTGKTIPILAVALAGLILYGVVYRSISDVSDPLALIPGGESPRLKIFQWEIPVSNTTYNVLVRAFVPAMHVENLVLRNRPRRVTGRLFPGNIKTPFILEVFCGSFDGEFSMESIDTPVLAESILGEAGVALGDRVEVTVRDVRLSPFERIRTHLISIAKSSSKSSPSTEFQHDNGGGDMEQPDAG